MIVGVSSDIGKLRDINQDSYYCSKTKGFPLFVVADGMGGHNAGEVASLLAIETIKKNLLLNKQVLENSDMDVTEFIIDTLKKANKQILNKAKSKIDLNGMGTTVTLAYIMEGKLHIGHIGDSRAYLLREKQLKQLTQDHSLVAELVRNGTISKQEAINHPQKNVITRALGTDPEVEIDIITQNIIKDDIILLCTDGLTNMVNDSELKNIILSDYDIQEVCNNLIKVANNSGGIDNTTVLLIKID